MSYTAEATSRNVLTVRMDVPGAGWEQWFLLQSDEHWDNPKCDRKLYHDHMRQAVGREAGIIKAGDSLCLMQGKFDKRSDKHAIRPEHCTGDYLDSVVKTFAEDNAPYAKHIMLIGQGNHETAILKRHETNMTERIVERLNTANGSSIQAGGYGGWVRFLFTISGTKRRSKVLHYFHGTGGGGPVTRGVIQTNRMAVFNPDADIILSGHTHDDWIVPIQRQRIGNTGAPYQDTQFHVRTPGYKDSWGDGYGGWEVEKMLGPKPKGAAWLRFFVRGDGIEIDVHRAA